MRSAVALVVVAVAMTACGGGSPSPSVAKLGSAATTTAAPSGGASSANDLAKLTSYATCMRAHGVPDFPDPTPGPNGGGGFQIRGGNGSTLDPNSTQFQAAQLACKSLLPNGGLAKPMTPDEQQKWLKWAACIRAHGVPDFADPVFSGGGVKITAKANTSGAAVLMQGAQDACKSLMPSFGGRETKP